MSSNTPVSNSNNNSLVPKINMPESPKEETPKKSGASQAIPNNILKALQTSSTATPKNKADFVIHISDDGQKFNTTERIVNGTCSYFLLFLTFTCLY